MFRGSITAIITPFRERGVDWDAFDRLVEWQLEQGTHGIVACGTTGEVPTLTLDEHQRVIERCVSIVNRRVPVIAGTGSNATAKTIDMTRHALKAGADAALIVTPYYNKPTQDGLYAHYKTVADTVNIPIIIYNIPGRCIVDMKTETMARLAEIPNIIGVKDATADMNRPCEVIEQIGPDFCQLSGEDATVIDFLEAGGHGCISVTSNVAPGLCAQMHNAWMNGEQNEARAINERLMPLHKALFVETSPAPVKYAVSRMGRCLEDVRLPLVAVSNHARDIVNTALDEVGIKLKKAA